MLQGQINHIFLSTIKLTTSQENRKKNMTWERCKLSFVNIASKNELTEGKMKGITVNGISILLVNLQGKYYAIGNICTHMACKLSNGSLQGDIAQCPCHGSRFEVKTGKVVGGPAFKPETAYQVKVEGDQIQVKA
jgi:nitrite reductase/ring-hydroxylating ferredoxin subunit